MNTQDLPLDAALDLVDALVATSPGLGSSSREKLGKEFARYVRGSQLRGAHAISDLNDPSFAIAYLNEPVPDDYGGWKAPSYSRAKARRWAIHKWNLLLREAGFQAVDPNITLVIDRAEEISARPLNDAEMLRVQSGARRRLFQDRGPATVAIAQTGATDAEIAGVWISHIDLASGIVVLGGSGPRARERRLTDWGRHAVKERVDDLGIRFDSPLVVRPLTSGASATASVSGELRQILNDVGFARDPRIKPKSLRAWAGRKVWESTGNPIDVAIALGAELQQAMDIIDVDWREAALGQPEAIGGM